MLKKTIFGFLLIVTVSVGGCQGQVSETSVSPTATEVSESPSTLTPVPPTASPLAPTPTPKEAQPTATDPPAPVLPTATDVPAPALPSAPAVDYAAPDFILPDLASNERRLSDLKGRMVLLNFWTTW